MENPLQEDLDFILTETAPLWEELRGKRIFITGGTGFFGCWLLESFAWINEKLDLNAEATVLSRFPDVMETKAPHLLNNPSITFVKGDVTNFDYPPGNFSHIIHAAASASASLNETNPLLMFETIVQGTKRTLEFAITCNAKKFLLTSSGAVYGKQPPSITHIPEDYMGAPDVLNPLSAYAEGKRAAEFLCSVYGNNTDLEVKIARCFAFVGPYLPVNIHYAIGNFMRDALNGGPIKVNGDGSPYRSYLYASELAIWLWTILFKGHSCQPYNVGSAESLAIGKLAQIISEIADIPGKITIAMPRDPSTPIQRYVPSNTRLREELGLRPRLSLSSSIEKTLKWHRNVTPLRSESVITEAVNT